MKRFYLSLAFFCLSCLLPFLAQAGTINGHEYVDMGFPSGTMWATCNLGASSPEQPGNYYAWGELTGYSQLTRNFNWNTYQLCNGTNTSLNKYCTSSEYGTVDSQTILENPFEYGMYCNDDNDDAANASWGLIWLIPTDEQMTELRNNTTYTIETINNVKCRKITSKLNGNSIIMPLAGYFEGTEHKNSGVYGNYWTSTLFTNPQQAYATWFPESGAMRRGGIDRCYAQSIRPVCVPITKLEISKSEFIIPWTFSRHPNYEQFTISIYPENATLRYLDWYDGSQLVELNWFDGHHAEGVMYDCELFSSPVQDYVCAGDNIGTSYSYEAKTADGSGLSVSVTVTTISPITNFGFANDKVTKEYNPLEKLVDLQFGFSNDGGIENQFVYQSSEFSANPNVCELSWHNDSDLEYAIYNATGKAKVSASYTEFGDNQYAECEVEITPGKCGEKLEYTVSHDQKKNAYDVHISGEGPMNNYEYEYFSYINYDWWEDKYEGNLNIIFDTKKITSIGNYTFYNCNTLHSIEIPASVTSIGSYAFADCPVLTSFTCLCSTPPSVDATTFDNLDFSKCTLYVPEGFASVYRKTDVWKKFVNIQELSSKVSIITYQSTDGKIVPPNNASSFFDANGNSVGIESNEYQNGQGTITFSGVITQIGSEAYRNVSTLKTISIPQTVKIIGASAFSRCTKLSAVTIPNSVTSIGDNAFYYCTALTDVELPNSVTSIGEWSFSMCSAFTSITIPSSVKELSQNAFKSCSGVSKIVVNSGNQVYDSRKGCNAIIETKSNILYIGCKNTEIPSDVEKIEDGSFKDCKGLLSITIPNSVTGIGIQAFYNCSSLTQVTISDNMKEISKEAFQRCTAIEDIYVGKSPASIVESSFDNTTYNNTTLHMPQGYRSAYQSASYWQNFAHMEEIITDVKATGISLNTTALTLIEGETSTLSASVTPSNATDKSVTWYSDNTSVATVSSTGVVTAKSGGTCKITATTNDGSNLSASCDVTVETQKATGISLNQTTLTLHEGESATLSASITPSTAADKSVTWYSDNTSVATVTANGKVTAKSAGTCKISATTNDGSDLSASCDVTVETQKATGISLNQTTLTLHEGDSATLSASITPSTAADKSVTWYSDNTSVATVSSTGVVTAKKVGTCKIKATTNDGSNLSADCAVTVEPILVTSISFDKTSYEMLRGEQLTLTPIILPANATNQQLTWESDNLGVAVVTDGVVTGMGQGSATITAKATDGSNRFASCVVTVIEPSILVEEIFFDYASKILHVGESFQINATVLPDNADNKTLSWTSSDHTVAMVADGFVIAISEGNCVITATATDDSNVSESCEILVTQAPIPVAYIILEGIPESFAVNDEFQVIAKVYPENADDKTLTWSSSDSLIAEVDQTGYVKIIGDGYCKIIATAHNGVEASFETTSLSEVTVEESALMIFNLDGTRSSELHKGINLILKTDGSLKKVFVK